MVATQQAGEVSLASFIESNHEHILERWERFARSICVPRQLDPVVLRDHAAGILHDIAADLHTAQTPLEQTEKSLGHRPRQDGRSQAELHGAERLTTGFSVSEAIAEFRALRASVLQLWHEATGSIAGAPGMVELTRFNEAIDQALAESVERFALDKDDYTRRFDTLLSSTPDLHYILGIDGRVIYVNQALGRLLNVDQNQVAGMRTADLCPALLPHLSADLRKVVDTGEPLRAEANLPGPDGASVTYRYVFLPVRNAAGQIESITGTARNISELKASEELTYRNAYYDKLTQLPNRALFHDRLEQNIKRAERSGHPLALMFIDLDGFKEVNDHSGHAAGDQLLKETGRRIGACVRGSDTVARIGGDEFTVILVEVHDILHIEILAQTILDELAKPYAIGAAVYHVTGSMGITLYPQDGHTPDDLLRNADQAMYVAKRAGRNRFSYFTAAMRDSAWARLKLIDELRHALERRQLEVYYQPIIALDSGAIAKAEALVRWHHPRDGMILPDAFIGLAEQCGLIGAIDAWVMAEAVAHARQWTTLLGRPFQVSVNKSPVEFMSVAMMNNWDSDIRTLGLAHHQIAVEITEGVLLNDTCAVRERLAMLKRAGVQFTIDDFGIGYSSMSYLKKFKVDFLKIDQSFVKDMLHSGDSGVFAETIILMAHKLGLQVIAEGVETVEQLACLKAMQCDYAQGFLFSEATPFDQFSNMLAAGHV